MNRGLWVLVIVVAAVGLAAVVLPLLGLVLFFRHEIGVFVFGVPEPVAGIRLVYQVPNRADGSPAEIGEICRVLAERTDPRGLRGYIVRSAGQGRIEVLVPEGRDHAAEVERVKRLVRQVGFLEFRIVADREKDRDKANFERIVRLKEAGQPPDNPRFRWYLMKKGYERYKEGSLDAWNFVYVVDDEHQVVEVLVDVGDGQDVTGSDLAYAQADSQGGDPIVSFRIKPEAEVRFARLTRPENKGRNLAIILDYVIQSAPVLRAQLSKGGIIEGYRHNIRERDEVITVLNSGELGLCLGAPIREQKFGSHVERRETKEFTRPAVEVRAVAREITEEMVRQHLGQIWTPAGDAVSRYIPPEERQFLGKICIVVDVNPPLSLGEVQERIDSLIHEEYPEVVGTLYRAEGKVAAQTPGEFRSFEIWVREAFGAKHANVPSAKFWTDLLQEAIGSSKRLAE